MDLHTVDLNLITVFDAILRNRNVTVAGVELGLSQPAMSYALAKMRRTFNDPLFFRVGNEMQPTSLAMDLAAPLRDVVEKLRADVFGRTVFDPATTTRSFVYCMTDIAESYFLPGLMTELQRQGARITLRSGLLDAPALRAGLAGGEVDFAVGIFPDLDGPDHFRQKLYESRFVCVARSGNPLVKSRLTLRRFVDAPQVAVSAPARSQPILEGILHRLGIQRTVLLRVQNFLTLIEIASKTDLIAVVPIEAAETLQKIGRLKVYPLPFESAGFTINQYWHRRYNNDPGNRWLRGVFFRLFQRDT
ncbi:MAG: LysR family transcriptional regulator [Proteobacteria bacterium]|nr:LysR family transcriptional regulator [Pseudomonadota bacterium]